MTIVQDYSRGIDKIKRIFTKVIGSEDRTKV
jgi:hypothetical protein